MSAQDEANRSARGRGGGGGTAMQQAQQQAAQHAEKSGQQMANAVGALTAALDSPKIQQGLMQMMPQALRKTLTPERVLRIATANVKADKYLTMCTPGSIIGAIGKAASLGLVPDGLLGHAYLVPRKIREVGWVATFQIGYKGLVLLVYRSTGIVMTARVVYANERLIYREGLDADLQHEPKLENDGDENPDSIKAAHSVALFPNKHQKTFRVMGIGRILKVRDESDAYKRRKSDNTPWIKHFCAMAEKTVMRRHCSQLPLTAEAQGAIRDDEQKENLGVGEAHVIRDDGSIDITDFQQPQLEEHQEPTGGPTPDLVPEVAEPELAPEPEADGPAEPSEDEAPTMTPDELLVAFEERFGVDRLMLEQWAGGKGEPPLGMGEWVEQDCKDLSKLYGEICLLEGAKQTNKLKKEFDGWKKP